MTVAACRRARLRLQEANTDAIDPRCACVANREQTVVACTRLHSNGAPRQEVRTFATTSSRSLALADWLESLGVEQVATKNAGVYCKRVWHAPEGHLVLALARAAHVRTVPGRQTDVDDVMWLAELLAHGLIRARFAPPAAVRELHTLARTRQQFIRERGSHARRIETILEDANLELSTDISDGETDAHVLLAHIGLIKATRAELLEALRGRITARHRFTVMLQLCHIATLDKPVAHIEQEVGLGLEPLGQAARLPITTSGADSVSAHVVVAKIGIDMSRFADTGHLLSWPCLSLRNDESAGKRLGTRLRRGGKRLAIALVQGAWAAVKVKGSDLQPQFHRLLARRDARKAIIGVAASMLTAAWRTLRNVTIRHGLGAAHFDAANATMTAVCLIRRLQQIGCKVEASPA
jgi:hypothetical protein